MNMSAPFDKSDTFVSFRGNIEVKGSDSIVVGSNTSNLVVS
jgi:hypothetical protein